MSHNIYYNPAAFGLEIVAELDPNESYQFDTVVLYRDISPHGRSGLYVLHDSGCSCPTPFEEKTREHLTPVNNLEDVERFVENVYSYTKPSISDTLAFFRKAREVLR